MCPQRRQRVSSSPRRAARRRLSSNVNAPIAKRTGGTTKRMIAAMAAPACPNDPCNQLMIRGVHTGATTAITIKYKRSAMATVERVRNHLSRISIALSHLWHTQADEASLAALKYITGLNGDRGVGVFDHRSVQTHTALGH